jgi:hypothetical protein
LQSRGQRALEASVKQYVESANFAAGGASLFGDTPTPETSFREAFQSGGEREARELAEKQKKNSSPMMAAPAESADAARKRFKDPNQQGFNFDPAAERYHAPTHETLSNTARFELKVLNERIPEYEARVAKIKARLAEIEASEDWSLVPEKSELEMDLPYERRQLEEYQERKKELSEHLDFLKGRENENLTGFAKEVQVGNSPTSRRAVLDVVSKLHSKYPALAKVLEKNGIVKKLLVGEEVFPEDSSYKPDEVLGLAFNDGTGRLFVKGGESGGYKRKDLWEHHTTSEYQLTPGDAHLSTFIHEAAHHFHYVDDKLNWQGPGTMGDKLDHMFDFAKKNDRLITKYARTNVKEYFAESFTAALMHPALLKYRDPGMYAFLREFLLKKGIAKLPA